MSELVRILQVIIKMTISSIVIGLKKSYFPLIHLPSCYRTVCSGGGLFVIGQFVIGQFVIGQFVIVQFVIVQFVIGQFVVVQFVIGQFVIGQFNKPIPFKVVV